MLKRPLISLLYVFSLVWLLTACGSPSPTAAPDPSKVQVDPFFREFYERHGGAEVFGAPLTPLLRTGSAQCQYTETALLLFDPQNPEAHTIVVAPLGLELEVTEPAVPPPTDPAARYLNGHIIDPEFVPMFDRLGVEIVGPPISEARNDPDPARPRKFQYFANMGFYRQQDDPPGLVRTLAYGLWRCDNTCRTLGPQNLAPNSAASPAVEPVFRAYAERFSPALLGEPLGPAYLNAAGVQEQVFANVALTVDPQAPGGVHPLALPELLGIAAEPLTSLSDDPHLYFYPLDGQLGHNVFDLFQGHLSAASGFEISGPPITEPRLQPDGRLRQCFQHLCLDYQPSAAETQVAAVPLGARYLEARAAARQAAPQPRLAVTASAASPTLPSSTSQEITVVVTLDGAPLANQDPALIVTLADGTEQPYTMPPTDGLGQTRMALPPMPAPPSTVFLFRACVTAPDHTQVCSPGGQFLIWNEP